MKRVPTESPYAQSVFRALADPTRRSILMFLVEGDMSIREVSQHFDMTRAAVKKHLVILEEGQLISVYARGRERINHLEAHALKAVYDWVSHFHRFWDERLSRLQDAVAREEQKKRKER